MSTTAKYHDAGRGPMIIGILWALTIIAFFVVIARVYVRNKVGGLSWDDWLMVAALVSC